MTGHLIHIGYPKTGSNFLRRWFAGHPQLSYADGGIAGFNNVYDIARSAAVAPEDIRYRVTSSEGLATPHADVGGPLDGYDRTRWGGFSAAHAIVCDTLASLFPEARILIVTRGFRSMIISSYSQYVRTGGTADFPRFCGDIAGVVGRGDNPWDYDHLIGCYVAAFGKENVIVLPYELLRDDHAAFTRELERRLGIDRFDGNPERVNAGLSTAELVWYPRITRAVRALPIGGRLLRFYIRATAENRLRRPIRVLQSLRPDAHLQFDVPDQLLEAFRGTATRVRHERPYAPYLADYLES